MLYVVMPNVMFLIDEFLYQQTVGSKNQNCGTNQIIRIVISYT